MKISSGYPWYSSYKENNYGDFFYGLIRACKPEKVVELGTKAGFSAYHIARGLKMNKKGSLDCYDLWEKYQYHSVPLSAAKKNLKRFDKLINFHQRDAQGVENNYRAGEVDILHIDLSNDGTLLETLIPSWLPLVNNFIIIEGGSKGRDQVEWMLKYQKTPINKWLKDFSKRVDIEYLTIEPFPSITIISKK